jgi:hypothetical protein
MNKFNPVKSLYSYMPSWNPQPA